MNRALSLILLATLGIGCGTDITDSVLPENEPWPQIRMINVSPNISVVQDNSEADPLQTEESIGLRFYRDTNVNGEASRSALPIQQLFSTFVRYGMATQFTAPIVLYGPSATPTPSDPLNLNLVSPDSLAGPFDVSPLELTYFESVVGDDFRETSREIDASFDLKRGFAYTVLVHGTIDASADRPLGVRILQSNGNSNPDSSIARVRIASFIPDIFTDIEASLTVNSADPSAGATETLDYAAIRYNVFTEYVSIAPSNVPVDGIQLRTRLGSETINIFSNSNPVNLEGGGNYMLLFVGYRDPSVDATLEAELESTRNVQLLVVRENPGSLEL